MYSNATVQNGVRKLAVYFSTVRGLCSSCVPAFRCRLCFCVLCFYRAMLCIRGTSRGPLSVRLSVTRRCSIETGERIELVLACELPSTRPTLF